MFDLKLKGKKALITGGGRGIGRSAALLLAEEGVDVAINYQSNDEAAQATLLAIQAKGVRGLAVKADVSDAQAVNDMVRQVVAELGGLDFLIHSAGIANINPPTPDNFDRVLNVHLHSTHYLCQAVEPLMKDNKFGRIVTISSIEAHTCSDTAYSTAMAGKSAYMLGLAKRLATKNITCNAISPGTIWTEMLDPFIPPERRREVTEKKIPLWVSREGIPGPDEIGKVVLFLCSDLASHITGQDIWVNGGQDIHW